MSKEKCEYDGKWFNFCNAMDKFIEPEANTTKRLSQVNVMNFKTGEERSIGVAYHKNKKDKIMINKCPWCGESLEHWKKGDD